MMILYNTLMGVCAGAGLLLAASAFGRLTTIRRVNVSVLDDATFHGFGAAFLVLGVPLFILGLLMTTTWPLTVNPPVNVAFGEPSTLLGALMTVAGVLTFRRDVSGVSLVPVAWVVSATGLVLAFTASAILSYNLIGDAPSAEPITGQFRGWENTTWGLAYAVAALGCLLTPFVFSREWARHIVTWSWRVAGAFFLLFSALNYRTHIGLLINLTRGTHHRW